MKIETFAVEKWMDEHETTALFNLAETCCASVSIRELTELSDTQTEAASLIKYDEKQTYGPIRGTLGLKQNLARLYSARSLIPLPPDNILITPGAIAANFTVFYSLIGPGDHVICYHPTYQQLFSVPRTLGADVDLWKAKFERGWELEFGELKSLIKENTKMIVINNPGNPTGTVIKRSLLEQIVELARENNIIVLCDEVYRPIFHGISPLDPEFPPSIVSLGYDNVIATGSMSKAYSLAGLRVGWVASRNPDLIERVEEARKYITIAVSRLDQSIAEFALSPNTIHGLLGRNIQLAQTNLAILEQFVADHSGQCEWVKPVAGTTAFIRFTRGGEPINAVSFCRQLQGETSVMFVPGDYCFGKEFTGFIRVGYVQRTEILKEGLARADEFIRTQYATVPLAS